MQFFSGTKYGLNPRVLVVSSFLDCMVVGDKQPMTLAYNVMGEQVYTELSPTATGVGNRSELTCALVTDKMCRFSLTYRGSPEKATCLKTQR